MLVAKFSCPSCQATLKPANPIPAGKIVKCPKCATPFEVKGEETPTDAPAPILDKTRPLLRPAVFRAKDSKQGIAQAPVAASDEAGPALVARFSCPACQATLKPANPIPAGKTVKCPKCAKPFEVKAEEEKPIGNGKEPASEPPAASKNADYEVVDDAPAEPKKVVKLRCPHCQATLKPASPVRIGKTIKCPKCSQSFAVADEDAGPAAMAKPASKPKIETKPEAAADYEVVDEEPAQVSEAVCPGCKAKLKLGKPVAVGKKIKCPKCTLLFAVQAPPQADDEPIVADVEEESAARDTATEEEAEDDENADAFAFNFDEPAAPRKRKKPEPKKPAAAAAKPKAKPKPEPEEEAEAEAETKPRKARKAEDEPATSSVAKKAALTIAGSVVGIAALAGAAFFAIQLLPAMFAPAGDWKEFSPTGGRCQVVMPGTPAIQDLTKEDRDAIPVINGQRFTARLRDEAVFSLAFFDLTPDSHNASFTDLFMRARGLILGPGSKPGAETKISASGHEGMECQIGMGEDYQKIARIILVRSQPYPRLYILEAEGRRVRPDDSATKRYFDSFQITATSDTGPVAVGPKDTGPKLGGKLPETTAGGWQPNSGIAAGLDKEIPIGKYLMRPPKLYKVTRHTIAVGLGAEAWVFKGQETGYQQAPALVVTLESELSPYSKAATLIGGLDLYFKDINQYLGLLLPQEKATDEGSVSGIRFIRRYFEVAGENSAGKGFVYLGRDGTQTITCFGYDSGNNQQAIVNLLETAVLTLRQDRPPPVVGTKPPDPTKPPEAKKLEVKERHVLRHAASVTAVALSPDGKVLAAASSDNLVRLWDTASGKDRATLMGHEELVRGLAFSADGATLATGSDDDTIKLWDVASGKESRTLEGHKNAVNALAFSPGAKYLVSGSSDQSIKVWDVLVGIELFSLSGPMAEVTVVAVSRDGNTIAAGDLKGRITPWDLETRKPRSEPIAAHKGYVHGVAFLPNGILASGGADDLIKLWNLSTGQATQTLTGHGQDVYSLSIDQIGDRLASGCMDYTFRIWDLQTNQTVADVKGHTAQVNSVAISGDGKLLATGSSDRTVKIWDLGR